MSPLPPQLPPTRPSQQQEQTLLQHQRRVRRARIQQGVGVAVLLSGYAVLAISPDTPYEWVLLRVAFGFGLLFIGFALAIAPLLSSVSHADE